MIRVVVLRMQFGGAADQDDQHRNLGTMKKHMTLWENTLKCRA